MLVIKNLKVSVNKKVILKDLNLTVDGLNAIIGPNGSGKSTLANAIMGNPKYKIKGKIIFNNKDITKLETYERAKLGLFMLFQHPPIISGVKLKDIIKENKLKVIEKFLNREINKGLSGGEKKLSEIAQALYFKPKFWLIDEIDSGLDLENLSSIVRILKENVKEGLIITHREEILEKLKPQKVHVMLNGKIICNGEWKPIWETVKKHGFKKCELCAKRQ